MQVAKIQKTDSVCCNQFKSLDIRVMSDLVRQNNINISDLFLVRDSANQILIATENKSRTAVIMLNKTSGFNDYESDVPRLIYELKMSG